MPKSVRVCPKHGGQKILRRGGIRNGSVRWRWICRQCESSRLQRHRAQYRSQSQANLWDRENPVKRKAHRAVENAISKGKIERQPCAYCGARGNIHAHHDDYSKPFDVTWLCPLHHKERHRELSAALNNLPLFSELREAVS